MPPRPRRFSQSQRRHLTDLLSGLERVDAILASVADEVDQIMQPYVGRPLAPDDMRIIERQVKGLIDDAYGATQAAAQASPLYQAMDEAILDSVMADYRDVIDEMRDIVTAVDARAWNRIDTILQYGPDDGDQLKAIRRMMDLPQVQQRRELKTTFFDPNRRWVSRQQGSPNSSYSLSQRTWKSGQNARSEIDRILRDYTSGNYEGRNLTRELRAFLNPDDNPVRYTNDGRTVRRSGSRTDIRRANNQVRALLRTEMQHANFATTKETSKLVPGCTGLRWLLSNHPNTDPEGSCRPISEADEYGLGPGVYPIDRIPTIPHHVQCRCAAAKVMLPARERADAIIAKYLEASGV